MLETEKRVCVLETQYVKNVNQHSYIERLFTPDVVELGKEKMRKRDVMTLLSYSVT